MDLTWTVDRDAGASFVSCRVHNDGAVRRRIRIENRLDGPVLPPRRAGVPEAGWDATGVTLRLAPDERRSVGFAVPAQPVEPPVELITVETIESNGEPSVNGRSTDTEAAPSAAVALGGLPDHRPPRAVVAEREAGGDETGMDRTAEREAVAGETTESDTAADETPEGETAKREMGPGENRTDDGEPGPGIDENRRTPAPNDLDEWFDAAEQRLELAERLTDTDLATATAVVEESNGVDELATLAERVTADAERLRAMSERASSLATRAEATDAPIEALERLA